MRTFGNLKARLKYLESLFCFPSLANANCSFRSIIEVVKYETALMLNNLNRSRAVPN